MLPKNPVFADVGGYDGLITRKFIEHYPDYKKVFLFEPEENNIARAKENLSSAHDIFFFQKGLSDKNATLHFSINDSASMICENVGKIDDVIKDRVSFIKMDIEGAESGAIEGAKETIKKYHPNMAICVYHKPDDFWKIPEQVLTIRNDYDLYMRHYTQGSDETVMFFIPKK